MTARWIVLISLFSAAAGCELGNYEHSKASTSADTVSPSEESSRHLVEKPPLSKTPAAKAPENALRQKPTPGERSGEPPPDKKLFAGWPKPQVALVISGNQHGYLEPCGCTGLENQKGGLARRHTLIKQLASTWNVLPIDAGNQVRRYGRQAELQFQITAEALKIMGYRAIGLGNDDLQLSPSGLLSPVASDDGQGPFTSANTAIVDRELLPRSIVVEAGGRKIGIVQVLGDELRKKVSADELVLESAAEGLKAALAMLAEAKCDFHVLLAFAYPEEAEALAKKHNVFDLVVASGGPTEPTLKPETIEGTKSYLVHTGVKGMQAVVVALYDDPKMPLRYERVPLDARFPDSKEMLDLMARYQDQLKELDLAGLGIKPLPHSTGRTFVGTETCGTCHSQAWEVWKNTPHAHATESLSDPKERSEIPRHYDPECLSCHVTGWDSQKYFPFKSGYLSDKKTPAMLHNGCENCHGPGSEHVAAESDPGAAKPGMVEKLRAQMRLPLAGKVAERKCMECHDIDNSPDFHTPGAFEKYWKQVEHKGKD